MPEVLGDVNDERTVFIGFCIHTTNMLAHRRDAVDLSLSCTDAYSSFKGISSESMYFVKIAKSGLFIERGIQISNVPSHYAKYPFFEGVFTTSCNYL